MAKAEEFQEVLPGFHTWQAFCLQCKVDLTSHALSIGEGLWWIDPIRLAPAALEELENSAPLPSGILLTNGNHERDAGFYQKRYQVPVYADPLAAAEFALPSEPFPVTLEGIEVLSLPGAGPGEVGFWVEEKKLLILGDIIINLSSLPFAPLPDKYATHPQEMRRSLQKLSALNPKLIAFAHGHPVRNGQERLMTFQLS